MSPHPLARIVEGFRREPSRTGSLIITFYGDAILPRGGSVWLGTLLKFLEMLEIDGGVVRTAVSRLAADGWLEREKVGRKSYYRLAARGEQRFRNAVAHVYAPHPPASSGEFDLLLIRNGADRDSARAALSEAGFGNPTPGVWVAPAGLATPAAASDAIRLRVSADAAEGRRLVDASWALDRTADGYRKFLKGFMPLAVALEDAVLDPADALLARVLMIHHYRRVILHDPLLPEHLLPPDWPAARARGLCGRLYKALLPASERWLDDNGESRSGALPPPDGELQARLATSDMLQK